MKKVFLSLALVSLGLSFANAQAVKKTKKVKTVKTEKRVVAAPAPVAAPIPVPAKPAAPAPAGAAWESGIAFDKETHDYGQISKGANGECEFRFVNKGKEPVNIINAVGSCGCTVPTYPKAPIAPGQSEVIKVKYDTQRVGPINKQVTVTIAPVGDNSRNATKFLKIAGNVNQPPAEPGLENHNGGPVGH